MRRTPRRPIPTRGCRARRQAARPSWPIPATADGNRNGLVVDARLTHATGMAEPRPRGDDQDLPAAGHVTVGADKAYDTAEFVARAVHWCHPACGAEHQRAPWLQHRRTHHAARGLPVSQVIRKRIEEANGWIIL